MSLILELAPELEEMVVQKAEQNGQSVSDYFAAILRENIPVPITAKPRRVAQGYGMFAASGRRVEEFLAERKAEAELEIEQAEERDRMRAERLQKEIDAGS